MTSTSKKYLILSLLSILILGSFLRIFHLGKPSYWVDELNHVYAAQSLLKEGNFELPSGVEYTRAAAFTWIVALGYRLFGESEFVSRLPSALAGILVLIVVFWIVSRFVDKTTALISTFLLAVLPLQIGWARLTRFYAILQLVTLLAVGLIFVAIEGSSRASDSSKRKWFEISIGNGRIDLRTLALACLLLLFALHLQIISVFVLAGFWLYSIFLFFENFWSKREPILGNRYFLISVIGAICIGIAWLIPEAKNMIGYGVSFLPQWAKYNTAQDRMLFFKYIMGKDLFPLGAFFFLGIFQAIFRRNHFILFSAFIFLVEIILFTFVFRYRMFQYIYNVLPMFVIVSAYSLALILKHEWVQFKNQDGFRVFFAKKDILFVGLFCSLILISPFFREGMSIPFRGDGQSNGAVTHLEWKEAKLWLHQKNALQNKCVLVSTLPLNLLYYAGKADYDINKNDYAVAVENNLLDKTGHYYDMYSGCHFLLTPAELDSVIRNSDEGYVIADTYRLLSPQYVNENLREFIAKSMDQVFLSPRKSIVILHWPKSKVSN